jgi:hypothetical protein
LQKNKLKSVEMKLLKKAIALVILFQCISVQSSGKSVVNWLHFPEENQKAGTIIKFEFDVTLNTDNPYDSDSIKVVMEIWDERNDTLFIPAFYNVPYRISGTGFIPGENSFWEIRFTPKKSGSFSYRLKIKTRNYEEISETRTLTIEESKWEGFVKTSARHRYFELESGGVFFPSGINLAHPPHKGTPLDYDYFFKKMAENGMNFTRIWLTPQWGRHALALEWTDNQYPTQKGKLGLRRINSEIAFRLDRIMDSALEHGIYVMLCFLDERELESERDWKENPYNIKNGGVISDPMEFFSDDKAKNAFRNRLWYLIARYSAYPNMFAWEFWNEFDHHRLIPDWEAQREDVGNWHHEMSSYLKQNDPHNHMVSTSVVGSRTDEIIWDYEEIDFVQAHSYVGKDHLAERSDDLYRLFLKEYPEKPFFIGEMGTDWRGFNKENNAEATGLHNGLWATTMGGHSATGMWWWWLETDEADLWYEWKELTEFTRGISWEKSINDAVLSGNPNVKGFSITSEGTTWIWCYNREFNWKNIRDGNPVPTFRNVKISLRNIPEGNYRLLHFENGNFRELQTVKSGDAMQVEIPEITRDFAIKLVPVK